MRESNMYMVSDVQVALFPCYMPIGHVRQSLNTCEMMDASEVAWLGLVNRVMPVEELMTEVLRVTRNITSYPATGVQFLKELINRRWLRTDLETAMLDGVHYSTLAHTTGEAKQLVRKSIRARKNRNR